MMEILNAAHNIVSVSPEDLPEHLRERQAIYYSNKKDMIVIVRCGDDTKRFSEMIAAYLELSPEGKQKAEEYFLSSGEDFGIRINDMLKEIAWIRREKGQETEKVKRMRTAAGYNNACCPSWHYRKAVVYGREEVTKGRDIEKRWTVYGTGPDQW